MNLDEAQKQRVTTWIHEGLKLSEIQNQLRSEFGIALTYMEVRFLVDDLKLVPKDVERAKAVVIGQPQPVADARGAAPPKTPASHASRETPADATAGPGMGGVSVTVDSIARPGAVASGTVKFSDGNTATWYLDQMGRLGMATAQKGYRPSAPDMQEFQMALEQELARAGL